MIRRDVCDASGGRAWLLIDQIEHARVAGDLAKVWGAGDFAGLEPRDVVLPTIYRHDDGWSSFDQAYTDFGTEVPAAGVVDGAAPLDWEDSWQTKIGAEYRHGEAFAFRGGYAYIPTPVPDHTLEPGNPDADSHNLHLGFGYRWGVWTADAAYALGIYEDRKVDNGLVSGEFENTSHFFGLSVGVKF